MSFPSALSEKLASHLAQGKLNKISYNKSIVTNHFLLDLPFVASRCICHISEGLFRLAEFYFPQHSGAHSDD
jgi:hypothetical protein